MSAQCFMQSFFGISLHSAMSEKGYSKKLQIHYMENGSVEIYSRNAERNTGKFPDVVAAISRYACIQFYSHSNLKP